MKRSGYTLAEVLIALAIVGIVAAVVAPMVNKFRPDTTKMAYLNTYDTLVSTINSIANNREFYDLDEDVQKRAEIVGFSLIDAPLYNTTLIKRTDTKGDQYSISSVVKFCVLLANTFVPLDDDLKTACQNQVIYNGTNFKKTFTDVKGTQYMVFNSIILASLINSKFKMEVVFDVNGDAKPNCMYDATECKKPDRFKILIAPSGYVLAADKMGQVYLDTRTKTRRVDINIEENSDYKDKAYEDLFELDETLIGTKVGKPIKKSPK